MKKIFSLILSVLFIMSFCTSVVYAWGGKKTSNEYLQNKSNFQKARREKYIADKKAYYFEKNYVSNYTPTFSK